MTRLRLPARRNLVSVSDVDGVESVFGYYGPLSYPMRERLRMALRCLEPGRRYGRILEGGYGCGILLPELAERCDELHGVDVHGEMEKVGGMLRREQAPVDRIHLSRQSLAHLDFPDGTFDAAVSVSTLEHIPPVELPAVMGEFRRVLKPGGLLILGFPTRSVFIRLLALLQGHDLESNHPSTESDILRAVKREFTVETTAVFPFFLPLSHCLHINLSARARAGAVS